MIRIALKGLLGRKTRAAMTALAIVLGVAMISGTYVLTDTISKAFDQIFVESTEGTSAVVSGKEVVSRSSSGNATIAATLLPKVKGVAGVQAAAGRIEDSAKVIGRDGKIVQTMGSPTTAYGIDFTQQRFNPLTLVEGEWPSGAGQVALDQESAEGEGFKVGDTVRIAPGGAIERFKLTAIVTFGSSSSLGGATITGFDLAAAQKLFEKQGQFDKITVAAASGVTPEQLVRRIKPLLPSTSQVKTASDDAKTDAEDVTQGLSFLKYFLLAFGGISLFVGSFVIFNTLSITVAQRIREFATLSTLGATRRQVLRSVLLESLMIGIVAAVAGLVLGVVLAQALRALLSGIGVTLPSTAIVFKPRTILVSLVVGVTIAVLASLLPALRATSVPPIAAVKEGATLPRSRLAPYAPYIATGSVLLALLLLGYGMFAGGVGTVQRLVFLCLGCLLLFVGIAALSTRFMRPLAGFIALPNARFGGFAGKLARENSMRQPARTAATAAALMIGIALVTFVAVLGQGLRASVRESVEEQVRADYIVSASNPLEPFPTQAGRALAKVGGVEETSSVRGDSAKAAGSTRSVTGIDPATISSVYHFEWKKGAGSDAVLSNLGRRGAVVSEGFADDENMKVGSSFPLVTSNNKRASFIVRGVFKPPTLGSLLGAIAIRQSSFDSTFPRAKDQNVYLNVRGDPAEATTKKLDQALDGYPEAKLETRDEFISSQQQSITLLLALLYVLLALSILVSLFGMVNTLGLSILERTRELGMLRAVGMTRRDVRRMVRHESVVIAAIGAAMGLPLGIFLAALVTRALKSQGIVFALPVATLVVTLFVAGLAGVVAAIVPARRASRLNILEALRYE